MYSFTFIRYQEYAHLIGNLFDLLFSVSQTIDLSEKYAPIMKYSIN